MVERGRGAGVRLAPGEEPVLLGGLALHVYPVGDRTPIWFPQDRLARELRRAGFVDVRFGRHADGEWTAAFKAG